MLRNERDKARKKLEETRKKTRDIVQLKEENEQKYLQKLALQQINEEKYGPTKEKMEIR